MSYVCNSRKNYSIENHLVLFHTQVVYKNIRFPPYTLDKHFKYLYFKSASLSCDSVDLLCACSCKMFFFITLMSVCTKIVLFQTYVTYVEHGSV